MFAAHPIRALSAAVAVIGVGLMTATAARAQSFTVLYHFCLQSECTTGESPTSLIQATDGALYGTTTTGGTNSNSDCEAVYVVPGCGSVFKITLGGLLTSLNSFCSQPDCLDGDLPPAGLIQAANGDFYGVLGYGGHVDPDFCPEGCGTIFKITRGGELTTLYRFCSQANCVDGGSPLGPLIQASNGDFYGTTENGGPNANCLAMGFLGCGTIFKITPGGTLTTLYTFCSQSNCADGAFPRAALIQASDGNFYGTTTFGGANEVCTSGCGTIFKLTPSGILTTLYSFCSQPYCSDGYGPAAPLIQASNGDLYGITPSGGNPLIGGGTAFEMSLGGTLVSLHIFCSLPDCTDGGEPETLLQASNGTFFGTTAQGGSNGVGSIFEMAPDGALITLYSFCGLADNCRDGQAPSGLIQATNGKLYGTTSRGGESFNGGIIYALDAGLGHFVALKPSFGEVGAQVTVLGTELWGSTSVTFNGTPALFNVNATGTAISATVPAGATTGTVEVTTPSGTLNSNMPFRVTR
jgi:uncharacterized repeat protein (TIGR03803 family)